MDSTPIFICIVFGLTTLLTVGLFYIATKNSKITLMILIIWLTIQTFLGLFGFYLVTDTMPPRFLLLVFPPILLITLLFVTSQGRQYLDRLDTKILTLLQTIRVLVELVLFWLFVYKAVPELMTFEGRNFDIFAGLTAPIVFYFGYINIKIGRRAILFWNIVCLGLLVNIIVNAVLSAPIPFQQFAFDQPNVAVLYFPFVWLPSCIVPLVFISHLATIRQLVLYKDAKMP